jgi:hypothetical protein
MQLGGLRYRGPLEDSSARLPFFCMYLLYLDDSGSAGNQNESHLVLAGLAIFERQVHWLATELEALAHKLAPANPDDVEFRASDIFNHRKPPWNDLTKEDCREAIKDVLRIVARSHPSTRAFACAVHKKSFPNTDPMELAFEELCNRFDLLLKRLHAAEDTQRGLIVLDKSSYETSLQHLTRKFRSLGTRWGVLKNLADTPLFVESTASRAVQIADHIAYAVYRRYEGGDAQFFDIIASRFDQDDGSVHGLVHKQVVDPRCMCVACVTRRAALP